MLFRKDVDDGIWCALLLPLVLIRAHLSHDDQSVDVDPKTDYTDFKDFVIVRRESILLTALLAGLGLLLASKLGRLEILSWLERPESTKARKLMEQHREKNSFKEDVEDALWWRKVRDIEHLTRYIFFIGIVLAAFGFKRSSIAGLLITLYPKLLSVLVTRLPRTFSLGEALLISQGASVFVYETVTLMIQPELESSFTVVASMTITGRTLLFFCCLVCSLNLIFREWLMSSVWLLSSGVFVLFGLALPYLQQRLQREPLGWLVNVLLMSNDTVDFKSIRMASSTLVHLWISLIAVSISILGANNNDMRSQVTRRRKLFHGLIVLVFASGLLFDRHLLRLTSQLLLCLMLVLEALRYHSVQPLAQWVNRILDQVLDTRDREARLVLTHIYLLVGCALPLWMDVCPNNELVLWSGVLSVGIGDAVASVVGSKMGRIKWPDSEKSLEGTVASIFVQMLVVVCLESMDIVNVDNGLKVGAAIIATSITEALTTQVDNLVLPLTMMLLLY